LIISKPLPDVGELVLVRINKVMPFGAYCTLTEYGISAYLPIAEVANGWIKNIHEFIKDGQSAVAKVIFVDKEKRAIDISLKRVSNKEKKDKLNESSMEKRAEQLFKQALERAGKTAEIEAIKQKLAQKFSTYVELLEEAYKPDGAKNLSSVLGSELAEALHDIAVKSIKPKVFEVSYTLELSAKNRKGNIDTIKEALSAIEQLGVQVIYEGAPHYLLRATGETYPVAEGKITKAEAALEKYEKQLAYNVLKKQ